MDFYKKTMTFAKRNNRYILLLLFFLVLAWLEVISIEKAEIIPSIYANPDIDESLIDVDLVVYYIQSQRFKFIIISVATIFARILLVSFVLYLGYYYVGSVVKLKLFQWIKISFLVETVFVLYRFYLVIIRFLKVDFASFDINARFSLRNILNLSDLGLISQLLILPLSAINVINIIYCILLIYLVSRSLKTRIISATKYVLCTYVLCFFIYLFLNSFVTFVNA